MIRVLVEQLIQKLGKFINIKNADLLMLLGTRDDFFHQANEVRIRLGELMISTNIAIVNFLINNIVLILLLAISILRVVPPEWAGFWKFNNNKESDGRAPRITIINFILTS